MDENAAWVEELFSRDHNRAHNCLKLLLAESAKSDAVYPYFDRFVPMLDHDSSYVRIRGIQLIAANARWDSQGKMEAALPAYLAHIADEKPIAARQCTARYSKTQAALAG